MGYVQGKADELGTLGVLFSDNVIQGTLVTHSLVLN